MPVQLSEMSDQDLVAKVYTVERDLVAARFKHSTNQLENTARLKTLRREIARLKTEARRREADQGLAKDALLAKFRASDVASPAAEGGTEESKGGFLAGIVDKNLRQRLNGGAADGFVGGTRTQGTVV